LDNLNLKYEIGVEFFPNSLERIEKLMQGHKLIEKINLEALVPKNINFTPEIFEKNVEKNYFENSNFYQEPILKQNKIYYNKGIPRSGKKIRGEYVSMQSRARDRREKIKKILEGKT
jgi:hypothetical protein